MPGSQHRIPSGKAGSAPHKEYRGHSRWHRSPSPRYSPSRWEQLFWFVSSRESPLLSCTHRANTQASDLIAKTTDNDVNDLAGNRPPAGLTEEIGAAIIITLQEIRRPKATVRTQFNECIQARPSGALPFRKSTLLPQVP